MGLLAQRNSRQASATTAQESVQRENRGGFSKGGTGVTVATRPSSSTWTAAIALRVRDHA